MDAIELYRFSRGDAVWRYTSADIEVAYDGETYTPETISRGADEQSQEVNRADMSIAVPRANAVAAEFIAFAPEQLMSVIVRRKVGDSVAVVWQGRVLGCSRRNNEAELQCESVFTALRRAGLTERYQLNCRHFLYSPGCGLSADTYKLETFVVDVQGFQVIVDGVDGVYEDGWFQAGYIRAANGEHRMIMSQAGGLLTLTAPIVGLSISDSVDMFPGCPHTLAACDAKFGNSINFGGFPYIPSLNPFVKSVV